MTLQIIAGVVGIIGCVVTLAACLVKFTSALASLETVVELLKETVDKLKDGSRETHEKIFSELDDHGKTLVNHETRLRIIEKDKKK